MGILDGIFIFVGANFIWIAFKLRKQNKANWRKVLCLGVLIFVLSIILVFLR